MAITRKTPPRPRSQNEKGAVELLEEALHLLRARPATLLPYCIGSFPFVLGLLYFWTDMSQSPFAAQHCLEASFGLAFLFLWMKCWQTVFVQQTQASRLNMSDSHWSWQRIGRLIVTQTRLQSWGLLILPVALLLVFPFPWLYALFQNMTVFGHGAADQDHTVVKRAWQQAKLWPRQNVLLIWLASPWLLVAAIALIVGSLSLVARISFAPLLFLLLQVTILASLPLSPVGLMIAVNIASVLALLPSLLKILFNIETVFTLSQMSLMNSTFGAIVCSLSYLCLDPVIKVAYALRCFYGEARHTGADLLAELHQYPRQTGVVLTGLLGVGITLLGTTVYAAPLATPVSISQETPQTQVSAEELERALRDVMQQRKYAWRIPREHAAPSHEEIERELPPFLEALADTLEKWGESMSKWFDKVEQWIHDHLPERQPPSIETHHTSTDWMPRTQLIMFVLLTIIACVLAIFLWRLWKRRRADDLEVIPAEIAHTPNLTDEYVDAGQLPEDGWLALAHDLIRQGQLRLAVRAVYLAILAHLAQQQMISIAKCKSDRDYERELRRRAHVLPDVLASFSASVTLFERIWYGRHDVTLALLEAMQGNHQQIKILLASQSQPPIHA